MILAMTLPQAFERLGAYQSVREDIILPRAFPDSPNSPYQPEYDWLFQYERQIAAFLEKWLRAHRYELIGEKGILCEALSNAFYHGHGKDPFKEIHVQVFVGKNGLLVVIKDNGSGFNIEEVYESYEKRKPYFSSAGNGIRLMAESPHFGIFHAQSGTSFYLLHLFHAGLSRLPSHLIRISPQTADNDLL